jgi:DNA-binding transcriptional LysR family regulator
MPSIEQYKMFVAVAEANSLRDAAKTIFKSQPTVTSAIKNMEEELQIELFSREQYRMKLTEQGKIIYRVATNLLVNHAEVFDLASHFNKGDEPTIKIAIEASFDLTTIIAKLERIQDEFASTQFVLQQEYLSGAFENLLQEQVDLAISPIDITHFPVGEIETKELYVGRFINVASPKLLFIHENLYHVKQLINEYQIVVRDTGTITENKTLGIQQGQRKWYVNNFETKLLLISRGLGWGSLPVNLVEKLINSNHLVELKLSDFPDNSDISYNLIKLKRKVLGPIATKLWNIF